LWHGAASLFFEALDTSTIRRFHCLYRSPRVTLNPTALREGSCMVGTINLFQASLADLLYDLVMADGRPDHEKAPYL